VFIESTLLVRLAWKVICTRDVRNAYEVLDRKVKRIDHVVYICRYH